MEPNLLYEDVSKINHHWEITASPPSSFCPSISKKAGKIKKSEAIDDCSVTFLIHYLSPEASNMNPLCFASLIFHPSLREITTKEGPKVLPEHPKISIPFCT